MRQISCWFSLEALQLMPAGANHRADLLHTSEFFQMVWVCDYQTGTTLRICCTDYLRVAPWHLHPAPVAGLSSAINMFCFFVRASCALPRAVGHVKKHRCWNSAAFNPGPTSAFFPLRQSHVPKNSSCSVKSGQPGVMIIHYNTRCFCSSWDCCAIYYNLWLKSRWLKLFFGLWIPFVSSVVTN